MKKFTLLLFMMAVFSSLTFAQFTGEAFIENAKVEGGKLTWELHFTRTNDWTPGLLSNALGGSSASFNFNTGALQNPSVTVEPGGPLDNGNYTVSVSILAGKCVVSIQFGLTALAGSLDLNTKTKLLTVSMDVIAGQESQTAQLSWDNGNTGFFDNGDATVVTTKSGSFDGVLPVELASFKSTVDRNVVTLDWKTTSEVDNHGFEVERKLTGDETAVFEKVGFVEGAGNSNSEKAYTFEDKVNKAGTFEYRLKQIDNDGTFKYYDAIEVDIEGPSAYELDQNYPNPFNPTTTIRFALPEASNVKLVVFNVLGQQVATLVDEQLDMGYYDVHFNGVSLASGTYFYRIATDNFTSIKKMIMIK